MRVVCALSLRALPSWGDVPPPPFGRHAGRCLRCQAEAAAYRSLRRDLSRLGAMTVVAPPAILPTVTAAVGEPGPARRSRWPVAAAVGGAVVAACGAVTVLVRHRARLAG